MRMQDILTNHGIYLVTIPERESVVLGHMCSRVNIIKASLNRTQLCTKTLLTVHTLCTKTLLTVHTLCTKTLLTVHSLNNYMF